MKRFLFSGAFWACLLLAGLMDAPFAAPAQPGYAPGRLIVKLKSTLPPADAALVRGDVSARVTARFKDLGTEVWDIGSLSVAETVAKLLRDPRVEYAEPDYLVHATELFPNDPQFGQQWSLYNSGQPAGKADSDMDAPEAWISTPGAIVLVGVIDSGADLEHEDLAAAIYTNPGEIPGNGIDDDKNGYADDVHGWDFRNGDNDPTDDNGHGTHVSGLIAAPGNNGTGMAGVCWSARIVPLKFLNENGFGATSDAINAIQYAIRIGVKVINTSWGSFLYSSALRDALEDARNHGVLIIASSGNDASNTDLFPLYPAGFDLDNILSVTSSDRNDALAWFADYGASTVDIAAPGYDILSTFPGNRYVRLSGSSMSCALVTGAAALLWSRAPFMSYLDMKAALFAGVDRLPSLEGRSVTGGRINLQRLVSVIDATPPGVVSDLRVESVASNAVSLAWSATGDDGVNGTASRYELRYSTSPINAANFAAATLVANVPHPMVRGSAESFEVNGLFFLTTYYFALSVLDEAGNRSPLSSVISAATLDPPHLQLSSAAFDANLPTGGTTSRSLTITNTGGGTLDFSTRLSPAWVRLDPASGRIAAGQGRTVQVIFDAAHLAGGNYNASVIIATNQLAQSNVPVGVALQVTSAPDISLSTTSLDLGTSVPLACAQKTLTVTNQGTLTLNVNSINLSEPPFVLVTTSFLLGPDESRDLTVNFCPNSTGKMTATLSIQSNDPDHPLITVTLSGKAVEPPVAATSPPALTATLNPGAAVTLPISISNAGGSDLSYVVSILGPQSGTEAESFGGPPPAADIRGMAHPLARDEVERLRARAFPMQVDIDATGQIDRNARSTPRGAAKTEGPSLTNGNHLVEVFGNDSNLFSGSELMRGNLFGCTKTTDLKEYRFYLNPIVSTELWFVVYHCEAKTGLYELVAASNLTPSTTGPGWYSSGDINLHLMKNNYYMMAATFVDNTGYFLQKQIAPYPIPASFGSLLAGAGYTYAPYVVFPPFGFQLVPTEAFQQPVAYYQTVITSGVVPWLSSGEETGTVHRDRSVNLDVQIDATGLSAGDHDASIRIASNDPATPAMIVPVHVHVNNAADIAVTPGPIDYGDCFLGVSTGDTIAVSNQGTNLLNVASILSNNSAFSAKPTSLFLGPGESAPVVVTFKPRSEGAQIATLTVTSSDPDEPTLTKTLRGNARKPPHISVPNPSVSESVEPGGVRTRTFSIVNSGESALSYELVFQKSGPAATSGGKIVPGVQPAPAGRQAGRSYSGQRAGGRTHARPQRSAATDPAGLSVLELRTGDAFEILDYLYSYPDIARVEEFDGSTSTPTLAELRAYDVVLVVNDFLFADGAAMGDVLADYVDAGGSVIQTLASFIDGYALYGRFADDGYSPFTIGFGPQGGALLGDYDLDHPIMAGVGFALGDALGSTTVAPGAQWVADWDNGFPFIATSKHGNVVAMNVFFGDGGYWDGDMPLILHNAIRWTTGVRWVRAQPERGVVAAHQSGSTKLTFDATELSAGSYTATLRVVHNDPLAKAVEIPVSLTVDSTLVVSGAGELPLPDRYALEPNRPNPFNPVTTIAYDLPNPGRSRLVIYDVSGAVVRKLVDGGQPAGRYSITWDGRDDRGRPAASGVYFYRLTSGTFNETRKMVLLK